MVPEGGLHGRKPVRCRREALDGADVATFGLDGEGEAGARRQAVDDDRAGAAHAVLAAHMGAGHAGEVAQRIGEQHARLDLERGGAAVQGEAHPVPGVGLQVRHDASSITLRPSLRTRSRR